MRKSRSSGIQAIATYTSQSEEEIVREVFKHVDNIEDAAKQLSVSPNTLRRWLADNGFEIQRSVKLVDITR
jgi:transposase-like protein